MDNIKCKPLLGPLSWYPVILSRHCDCWTLGTCRFLLNVSDLTSSAIYLSTVYWFSSSGNGHQGGMPYWQKPMWCPFPTQTSWVVWSPVADTSAEGFQSPNHQTSLRQILQSFKAMRYRLKITILLWKLASSTMAETPVKFQSNVILQSCGFKTLWDLTMSYDLVYKGPRSVFISHNTTNCDSFEAMIFVLTLYV